MSRSCARGWLTLTAVPEVKQSTGRLNSALAFPGHAFQLLAQVAGVVAGLAQIPHRVSRFIDGGSQLQARKVEQAVAGAVDGALHGDGFKQRGDASVALNDGVVHLAGEAAALTENGFEASAPLAHAILIDGEDEERGQAERWR